MGGSGMLFGMVWMVAKGCELLKFLMYVCSLVYCWGKLLVVSVLWLCCSVYVVSWLVFGVWLMLRLICLGCRFSSMWNVFVMVNGEWFGSIILFDFIWIFDVVVAMVVISMVGVELVMFGSEWCSAS